MFRKPPRASSQLQLPLWQEPLTPDAQQAALERALAEAADVLRVRRTVRVEWRRYPTTAGRAYCDRSLICLSSVLLTTADRIRDTALHEYAHLYVFENFGRRAKPHGAEWRAAMAVLGLEPEVHHSYECTRREVVKPYVCACEACGAELRRARPLKRNRRYTHLQCGGRVRFVRRER